VQALQSVCYAIMLVHLLPAEVRLLIVAARAGLAVSPQHEQILAQLLHVRHHLAQTVSYPTYAHKALADTMAGSPGVWATGVFCSCGAIV
jgi:Zn-dependent oligopeptidase